MRRAGVSAFGFGGTNFHVVLEEYIPHRLNGNGKRSIAVSECATQRSGKSGRYRTQQCPDLLSAPAILLVRRRLRGALVIGAASEAALAERLRAVQKDAEAGRAPAPAAPAESDLRAPERIAIDYADAAELADKSAPRRSRRSRPISRHVESPARPRHLPRPRSRAQSGVPVHRPRLAIREHARGAARRRTDRGRNLRRSGSRDDPSARQAAQRLHFRRQTDAKAVAKAEEDLRQTAITQPAVLAIDIALTRLLAAYGIQPDMTMGHSLGEYGALVAAGALPFEDALEAVSARGREMTHVAVGDNGQDGGGVCAARRNRTNPEDRSNGYVVIANVNSNRQAVIGGASEAVEQAMEAFLKAGYNAVPLPVSHAFHTSIVAPASEPLRQVLERLHLQSPRIPIVANVNGEFYPTGPDVVPQMLDILAQQVASPVQFVKGLRHACTTPARACSWKSGRRKRCRGLPRMCWASGGDVVSLFTNHPKFGDIVAFNQALCGLYAAGLGRGIPASVARSLQQRLCRAASAHGNRSRQPQLYRRVGGDSQSLPCHNAPSNGDHVRRTRPLVRRCSRTRMGDLSRPEGISEPANRGDHRRSSGLAGNASDIFDDANIGRILRGEQFIDVIPSTLPPRHARQTHYAAGQERQRRPDLRDHHECCGRHQAGGPRRRIRSGKRIRHFRRSPRRPRPRHPAGHRRRHRRTA